MVDATCQVCATEFAARDYRMKYCSQDCRIAGYASKRTAGPARLITKTCQGCGEQFTTKTSCRKWCKKSCGDTYWRRKRVENKKQRGEWPACHIEGCDKDANPGSMNPPTCGMHATRMVKYGEYGPAHGHRRPSTGEYSWVDGDGYVIIRSTCKETGKRVQYREHRYVMEQMLGRPLDRRETPHHINGIRHDNRPENLELWVKPQPAGQRVDDLVAWVVQHYPDLVREAQEHYQLRLAI